MTHTLHLRPLLAILALLLLAAATGCTDHDNDPTTPADNGLPVDFSSIRIAASANGTGGSTSNVPTADEGDFYLGDVIHARLTHNGSTQEALLRRILNLNGSNIVWQADKTIYWQSTDPNTGQTLTLSRGEEGDFTLPDDMGETIEVTTPDSRVDIPNYTLHDRLFHSYRGPMPATPITWELQHRMAQIVVTLTRADGSTLPTDNDLDNARVSMTLPALGHFDGVNGNVSRRNTGAGGGTADTKPVKFYRSAPLAGVYPYFAVALPGSTDTRTITITIPANLSSNGAEQTYQYTAPADITLEAGRSHVFRLSLGNRVSALSITTTDWQPADAGPGVTDGLGIRDVTPGSLQAILPKTVIDYGRISVSGELNKEDYLALSNFINSLPSPVSLELEITGGSGIITKDAFFGCDKLGAVVLKGITEIGKQAFMGGRFTSITLPEGLTTIGISAFAECRGLKSITLPSSVTYLGPYAFGSCDNLASVSLPEGLQTIDGQAFSYCTSLKSISLPSKVTTWGEAIFQGSGLTSITLPEGMKEIPSSTFRNCKDLQTITLPSTITAVGVNAFNNSGLTSIILPEGVKTIGEAAFKDCTKLQRVAVADTKSISVGTDAFAGTPDTKELFDYSSTYWTEWPGVTWKAIHISYQGSGDKLDSDSYMQHINP